MNLNVVPITLGFCTIIILQSVLMISANEYILNNEGYSKKGKFLKYIKLNIQTLLKSVLNKNEKKLNISVLLSNFLVLLFLFFPVSIKVLHSCEIDFQFSGFFYKELNSYFLLYSVLVVFLWRMVNYIIEPLSIDINKFILKGLISLAVVLVNFSFVNYFMAITQNSYSGIIAVKILFYLNSVISVYAFDNLTKYNSKKVLYQNKVIDKICLYFMLLSIFFILNSGHEQVSMLKILYYSMSIFLTEFLASYITKTFGYLKVRQTITLSYQFLINYYLGVYLLIFLGIYGF